MSWAKTLFAAVIGDAGSPQDLTLGQSSDLEPVDSFMVDLEPQYSVAASASCVMTGVFDQHSNLSAFNSPMDRPASPSRKSHRAIDTKEPIFESLALGMAIPRGIPIESSPYPRLHTPPTRINGSGSMRSILREPNTPGTGRKSVRFFSHDALRVISPGLSDTPESILKRLQSIQTSDARCSLAPETVHPSGNDKFSPILKSRDLFTPSIPPTHISSDYLSFQTPGPHTNTLDMPITTHDDPGEMIGEVMKVPDCDATIELPMMMESPLNSKDAGHLSLPRMDVSPRISALNSPISFSPPMLQDAICSSLPLTMSQEETMFHSAQDLPSNGIRHNPKLMDYPLPVGAFTPDRRHLINTLSCKEPATPRLLATPSPAASQTICELIAHQDKLIVSLELQLVIQRGILAQYRADLESRDKLVALLNERVEIAEKESAAWRLELERRKSAISGWKKRVWVLDVLCKRLESEVTIGRKERADRSIMDMTSHETLYSRIKQLDLEAKIKESEIRLDQEEQVIGLKTRLGNLKGDKQATESQIQTEEPGVGTSLQVERSAAQISKDLTDAMMEASWEQLATLQPGRAVLRSDLDDKERVQGIALRRKDAIIHETNTPDFKCAARGEELVVLKGEVEAQWRQTEVMEDQLKESVTDQNFASEKANTSTEDVCLRQWMIFGGETKTLVADKTRLEGIVQDLENTVATLRHQTYSMESRVRSSDEEVQETRLAIEEIELECNHLAEDLHQVSLELHEERDNTERLTNVISQLDARVLELEREQGFADDNVARLRDMVQNRDGDHEEVGRRETETLKTIQNLLREKAAAELALENSNERRREEVESLRRRVHELEQESADKEVMLTRLSKCRTQDMDDKVGLNIALDSKQQELELLKRKLGVRGTAGSTPAASRIRNEMYNPITSIPRPDGSMRDTKRGTVTPAPIAALRASTKGNGVTRTMKLHLLGMQPPSIHTTEAHRDHRVATISGALGMKTRPIRRTSTTNSLCPPAGTQHRRAWSLASKFVSTPGTKPLSPATQSGSGEKENHPQMLT